MIGCTYRALGSDRRPSGSMLLLKNLNLAMEMAPANQQAIESSSLNLRSPLFRLELWSSRWVHHAELLLIHAGLPWAFPSSSVIL